MSVDNHVDETLREDMALLAYRQGRVLVIKMHGYLSRFWRVPQGIILPDVDYKQRAAQLLAEMVSCTEVGQVRDTRVHARVYYDPEQRGSNDPQVTSRIYAGKNLHFYTAEIACPEELLVPAGRVKKLKMVEPAKLQGFLSPEEMHAVDRILQTYVIEV
ncbi:hypothetical protein KY359_00755 [Candidatus Woesearchaeota archaeon]|nr:hypothetical protein [Candidatus Woesearchaeota archaeon]